MMRSSGHRAANGARRRQHFAALLLGLATGAQCVAAGNWYCQPASGGGADALRLEVDRVGGGITMQLGGLRLTGRHRLEQAHLVAVFDSDDERRELTLGTASGRVLLRQVDADGRRRTIFAGLCRPIGSDA